MDINYLERAGALLFGDNWIIPMARALGVNRRTIYKWKVQAEVPELIGSKLEELTAERGVALKEFRRELNRAGPRRSLQR